MVVCVRADAYIFLLLELVVDESLDDASLAGSAIAQEDDLVGFLAQRRTGYRSAHCYFAELI